MRTGTNAPPIIIKRKKVVGGEGHHGGAWKVAYADFVTAMMAFFLLMWLLNATTEKQRKGIADYFNPTVPVNRVSGGGDGMFSGDSVFADKKMSRNGTGSDSMTAHDDKRAHGITQMQQPSGKQEGDAEIERVSQNIDRILNAAGGESMVSEQLARRIVTRVTDEGLIVEFFDLPGDPLFAPDTDSPETVMTEITQMLVSVFSLVPNEIAVNGYVRAYPQILREDPVWPLSGNRATRVREMLLKAGLDRNRIQRVSGFADHKPAIQPAMSERNNRIEVILLRKGR